MSNKPMNPKDLVGITKPQLNLVPASSIVYQSLAMADGARKYGPYNWRETPVQASIYVAAAMRHLQAWYDSREELAEDSKVPHLAHVLGCIGILVDALECNKLIDDRPDAGAFAALIKKYTKPKQEPAPEADTGTNSVQVGNVIYTASIYPAPNVSVATKAAEGRAP